MNPRPPAHAPTSPDAADVALDLLLTRTAHGLHSAIEEAQQPPAVPDDENPEPTTAASRVHPVWRLVGERRTRVIWHAGTRREEDRTPPVSPEQLVLAASNAPFAAEHTGLTLKALLERCEHEAALGEPWTNPEQLLHDQLATRLHLLVRWVDYRRTTRDVMMLQRCVWASARRTGHALPAFAPPVARTPYLWIEAAMDALAHTLEPQLQPVHPGAALATVRMKW